VRTLKIGLENLHKSAYNFKSSGCNLTTLYQEMWLDAEVITWVQILEGCPQ